MVRVYNVLKKISMVIGIAKVVNNIIHQLKGDKMKDKQLKKIFDKIAETLEKGYDIFHDGFQFWETIELIGVMRKGADIIQLAPIVAKESSTYTPEYVKECTRDFTERVINIFRSESSDNEIKIDASLEFIQSTSNLIQLGVKAGRDGWDVNDLQYIPLATSELIQMVSAISKAVEEMSDLNNKEISIIAGTLASKILSHLK